ncbi:hypothetical protein [Xylanimonas allomyrinae]|nr:hypothetical protein [Xylanimonas allomyrinae]
MNLDAGTAFVAGTKSSNGERTAPLPGGYSTTATAEEGLWARKGWVGRSN